MTPDLQFKLDLCKELRGTKCAGCGGPKKSAQSFCYGCFKSLTTAQQRALWKSLGKGYEQAYAVARQILTPGNTAPLPQLEREAKAYAEGAK